MADINVIVLPDGTEYPISDYYLPVSISNPTGGQVLKYDATNQVWYNGEDASGSSVLYGTSAPTSQLGTDGCLYVKYTEGTGGASDTVDSLYVKLDGSWCQISTGGGGGTSDYNDLTNKPQINSVELSGNKSLDDLGIQPSEISKTASGSIASFTDGGDDIPVSEYECEIVAQQASGTPTPDNPLPITGFSQAEISVSVINQWDEEWEIGGYDASGQPNTATNRIRTINYINIKPNTIYRLVCPNTVAIYFYDANKNFISSLAVDSGANFTTPDDCAFIRFSPASGYGTTYNNDISINYPSTNTQYHAYKGNLYTVAFGQTIYGGRLVYANGEWSIEATHQVVEKTWGDFGSKTVLTNYTRGILNITSLGVGINNNPTDICSIAPFKASYSSDDCHFYISVSGGWTNANMFLPNDTPNNTAIQIVYKLATPVIIPLTSSAKIKTLPGVNNIFSNTGDSTLKYFTNDADEIAELVKAEIASTNTDYHEYSTEEKIVGKWIDGNTLYEKTFIAQVTSTAYTIDVSALNIDEVISNTAFIKQTSGNVVTAPYATSNTDYAISYYGSNLIKFSYAGAWNTATWCVTIRYTKSESNTRSLNLSKGSSDETKSEEPVEEKKSEEVDLKLTEKTEEEES